jgi:hypothetical protein
MNQQSDLPLGGSGCYSSQQKDDEAVHVEFLVEVATWKSLQKKA